MNTKHTAFEEKQLGHAPNEYGYAESVAWAIGYNAALERTAAPELLKALWEIMISPSSPSAKQRAFDAIAKATGTNL